VAISFRQARAASRLRSAPGVVTPLNERQRADLRLATATGPFTAPDGSLVIPAVALVAAADA
jgi:hypothetical protein